MLNLALVLTEPSEACALVGRIDEARALADRLLETSRSHTRRPYHMLGMVGEGLHDRSINRLATNEQVNEIVRPIRETSRLEAPQAAHRPRSIPRRPGCSREVCRAE